MRRIRSLQDRPCERTEVVKFFAFGDPQTEPKLGIWPPQVSWRCIVRAKAEGRHGRVQSFQKSRGSLPWHQQRRAISGECEHVRKKELSYAQLVSSRTYQLCVPETCIQSENAHLKLVLLDSSVAIRVTIKQTLCSTNTSLDVAECSLAIKSCPPVHRVRCDCKKVWKL